MRRFCGCLFRRTHWIITISNRSQLNCLFNERGTLSVFQINDYQTSEPYRTARGPGVDSDQLC